VNHEGFVLRSLRRRPLATALSALSVALGVALVVSIDVLRREARAHFEGAAVPWDLVVGPKGSPLQIVLNAVFHMEESPGTLPESAWKTLRADARVEKAIPYAVGDTVHGFRVVGTTAEILGCEARRGVPLRCAAGRAFAAFDPAKPAREAVLGATAAEGLGHRVGEAFVATHGLDEHVEGEEHEEAPFTVSGVLERTGTPMDRVVLVDVEAFWAIEGHDPTAGTEGEERRLSAVLVKARTPVFANSLFFELRSSTDLQPVRPFQEVRALFDLLGRWDRLLLAVAGLVVVVAAVGILVSMTNSMNERRRTIALMRALGARRRVVAGLMVGEAAAVGALGAGAGLLLGHGVVAAGARAITDWSGVRIRAGAFAPEEVLVFAGAVAICALAGLLPAAIAYRADVAEGLASEA
jgi:putative ABC transport system permease protein